MLEIAGGIVLAFLILMLLPWILYAGALALGIAVLVLALIFLSQIPPDRQLAWVFFLLFLAAVVGTGKWFERWHAKRRERRPSAPRRQT